MRTSIQVHMIFTCMHVMRNFLSWPGESYREGRGFTLDNITVYPASTILLVYGWIILCVKCTCMMLNSLNLNESVLHTEWEFRIMH